MHQDKVAVIARRKMPLMAGAVLMAASWLVIGAAQAQSQPWKSHLSADAPEVLYRHHCAVCHGENGDGKSLAAYALDPPPKDFTSAKTRRESSRAHMIEVLSRGARTKTGKPTAMIAWKNHLSREQMEAVVDYIIINFMDGKLPMNEPLDAAGHQHHGHDHSAANVKAVDYPYGLKPDATRGKSVYSANCAACHGEQGDGRGNPARVGTSKPRNFHDADFREFANGFTLYSAVSRGRGHMPDWDKKLTKQEIADVSEYVLRTFSKPGGADSHAHHASHGNHADHGAHEKHGGSHGKPGSHKK